MVLIVAAVDSSATPQDLWAALVDWPAHGRWIPLTTVRVLSASGAGVGARFVGRTALGPVGFDDPMEVTRWDPPVGATPGVCGVVKQGRVVLGIAQFEVSALPTGGGRVVWTEDIEVWPVWLTRPLGRILAGLGGPALRRTLQAMATEVEARGR